MAGTGAGYDLSVTTFSPDGRVFQVEYAQKAVENSGTAIALCCKDGVIFGVEKFLVSKMLVKGTNKRIYPVTKHTGMCIAGLVADARQIVSRGRGEAQNYKNSYREEMPPNLLAERLGMFVHAYTLYWVVRPFGCSILLGDVDKETREPSLYTIESSGHVFKYRANAIGKGKQAAKTELEKLVAASPDLTCKEALVQVARIIHKVHDEKDRDFELECSWICSESDYTHAVVPEALLVEAEKSAKALLEAEEDQD